MKIVKELEIVEVRDAIHSKRRIVVLQRDDGYFTFVEEYFYVSEFEGKIIAKGWQQLPPNGIYATAAIAESEGRAAFARWHRLVVSCPYHAGVPGRVETHTPRAAALRRHGSLRRSASPATPPSRSPHGPSLSHL